MRWIASRNAPLIIPRFYGWPDAQNTGPLKGTIFTEMNNAHLTSSADGQIFENLFLNPGTIQANHHDCIVRNCIINGYGANGFTGFGVGQNDSANVNYNLTVLNCRIYTDPIGTGPSTGMTDGVRGGMNIGFCDISCCENAIDIGWPALGASQIHDNYIHDFTAWDATQAPPDGSHTDGLQTFDISFSGGMTVRHNTILGWQTTGTYLPQPNGSSSALAFISGQHDLTVDNNIIAGGSYSIYGPSQGGNANGPPVNVQVTNNHFSTLYFVTGGAFGTHSGWDPAGTGFIWSGNVWHDGPNAGTAVNVLPWPN
jgi:hypothetical protein